MDQGNRRTNGVYYTPEPVVDYIVERTLVPLLDDARRDPADVRILDPACGDGAFLTGVYRTLLAHAARPHTSPYVATRAAADALRQVFGVDIDADALREARNALARIACDGPSEDPSATDEGERRERTALVANTLASTLRCGDALLELRVSSGTTPKTAPPMAWNRAFPEVFRRDNPGFDVVLGNPPYVNIRVLTQSRGPDIKRYFRQHYQCAAGSYDLYVLFMERAFQLLREGGRCGMIVPNKIAALDYAHNCRALLLEQTTLVEVVDAAGWELFPGAAVYPYILIWEKHRAPARHRVSLVRTRYKGGQLQVTQRLSRPQRGLSPDTGFRIDALLEVEARVPCVPLGQVAQLHSGTTGFIAHELGNWLVERDAFAPAAGTSSSESHGASLRFSTPARSGDASETGVSTAFPFIVSGNIDRYCIRPTPVRYMGRKFLRPLLPGVCPLLTARKRQLFSGRKIVVAGMCRRLEAAWDEDGRALGVQVFAVADPADPWYLLGLLNSKLLTYLFRSRFEAKRLGGSFLSVNKGQLAQLPMRLIRPAADGERRQHAAIVRRVREMLALQPCLAAANEAAAHHIASRLRRLDEQIDEAIYRLYRLTKPEIERVEQTFAGLDGPTRQ